MPCNDVYFAKHLKIKSLQKPVMMYRLQPKRSIIAFHKKDSCVWLLFTEGTELILFTVISEPKQQNVVSLRRLGLT